jgi:para-aminobenzoate synthetase component 1
VGARFRFRPRVFELDGEIEPGRVLARLAGRGLPMLLDSAAGEPRRASLCAFDPVQTLTDVDLGFSKAPREPSNAWPARLRERLRELSFDAESPAEQLPGPFHGGLLCALAYDLGAAGERPVVCAPEPWGQPRLVGGIYVDFLVRDEAARRTWLVLGDEPGDGRPAVEVRRREILALLHGPPPAAGTRAGSPRRHTEPAEHRRRIEELRASISRGDLYQANLAHRLTVPVEGAPEHWYGRLREANAAPYMGFARWRASDGYGAPGALLCASPELFFEFAEGEARTRPIKGTIARSADPRQDAENARRLLSSEKDLAELAMIVDLERNDLGRSAIPGGVRVEGWPSLRSYARVHHLMADVVARTRPDLDAFDVLAALFPGGSITGAPKLAAMDEIARLEGHGRGFFCGSMGFVDLRGQACFNIMIRTFLWRRREGEGAEAGELSCSVGGGITWSSEAEAEEQETLAKAAGMLAALEPSGSG